MVKWNFRMCRKVEVRWSCIYTVFEIDMIFIRFTLVANFYNRHDNKRHPDGLFGWKLLAKGSVAAVIEVLQ